MLSYNYELSSSFGSQEYLDRETSRTQRSEGIYMSIYDCLLIYSILKLAPYN
jgi:hypothetical protein